MFHNVIILIRSVFNKNSNYYYNIFLEKASFELPKKYKIKYKIKMLYYDRIDVFEGIGVNKTSEFSECDICHYWYFLNKGFKFKSYVCNKCHDLVYEPQGYCNFKH